MTDPSETGDTELQPEAAEAPQAESGSAPAASSGASSSTRWMHLLAVALAVIAVYAGSLSGPFIFDDEHALVENTSIRSLWPPWAPLATPADTPLAGRPVASLSFAVNFALGGLSVTGYHVFNVLLHLLAVLTLLGLVRRTLELDGLRDRFGAAAPWLAGASALLWGVHPLVTESVTYVVQRTELLMGLFYLLTLYFFVRAVSATEHRGRWFAASVAACALGMGSKEVMVSAPLAVLLFDRLFVSGSFAGALRERAGYYGGLAATWLVLVVAVLTGGGRGTSVGFGASGIGPFDYLLTQAGVLVHYLRLAFWPSPLVLDYDDWPIAESFLSVAPQLLLVTALVALVVWGIVRGRGWAFLGACFFLILAPTSSVLVIATEVAAERRMYLPLAALVVLVVVGGYGLLTRRFGWHQGERGLPPRTAATVLGVVLAAVAGVFAFAAVERNADYRTALSILGDTVEKRPGNARALNNYGAALLAADRTNEAIGYFSSALEISPNDSVYTNLGIALAQRGQLDLAVEQYEKSLEIEPDNAKTLVNYGNALLQTGRFEEAAERFERSLELAPERAEAHNGLAVARWQLGQREEGLAAFQRALELRPDYRDAHFNLGMAYLQAEQLEEAESHLKSAVRLDPDYARAQAQLGVVLARQGRSAEAVPVFREVVRLRPDDPEAHINLAKALAGSEQLAEALRYYEQALELRPESPSLATSLAWIYATHPDAEIRNGAKAVKLAESARDATGSRDPIALDTLAAAYGEVGRFEDAVAAATQAADLAQAGGRPDLAAAIEAHRTELQAGRPLRDG
ncbi:MAG: tetratricopeptide repeat protein [Acidobacteriota bacterium]|nr:tetratricopeptide repeat protein [Acidobacteriota bacterium]